MNKTRRQFLEASLGAGAVAIVGCGDETKALVEQGCGDPFLGGELLGTLTFVDEGDPVANVPVKEGLDGRLYSDLNTLTPNTLITPVEHFFIRTRYPDQLDPSEPWAVQVHGLVHEPITLNMETLTGMSGPAGVTLLECSGNGAGARFGLLSACEWDGVPMDQILDMVSIKSTATGVLVSGFDDHSQPSANNHSKPGAEWVFTFDQLTQAGAILATHMNGEPLPPDHGFPVRLLVPGWYGCACPKWVNSIQLVDDSQPATSQMKEFAKRTHQDGVPALAKSYLPAAMDQAAMPVRVEKWRVDGKMTYRVVGILWGGHQVTDALAIRFGNSIHVPVNVCPAPTTNNTWTLWTHQWTPPAPGVYDIQLRITDPAIPTTRLDVGFYNRAVLVEEV